VLGADGELKPSQARVRGCGLSVWSLLVVWSGAQVIFESPRKF